MGRPEIVWEQCYSVLSKDILFTHRRSLQCLELHLSDEEIMNMTLSKIEDKLQANGVLDDIQDPIIMDELNFDLQALKIYLTDNLAKMNRDQKIAFETIIHAVDNNAEGFFFVYGYGGTGKTYLYNTLSDVIRSNRGIVLNVASNGIASLLLPNGRTAHSRFKIPLDLNEDFVCCIKQVSDEELEEISKFSEWLLSIGNGLAGDSTDGESEVQIDEQILIANADNSFDNMVNFVYRNLLSNLNNMTFFKDRSILGPTLEVINEVNVTIMDRLEGEEKLYLSSDTLCVEEGNLESDLDTLTLDILNAINCSGLPPYKLTLKVGILVMLLCNIDQSNGLCNGTRLQVRRLGSHIIECVTLIGDNVGQVVIIPRMNMIPNNQALPFRFQRRQFPIIVSFAMTNNKSKGQTLSTVGLYLPRSVFIHGQLYVALSRVKSKIGLRVLIQKSDYNQQIKL
ncbi:uncharacterized protein LOC107615171 [Arachis ipaensis]|uniref:ATP-dependent DNA helicase n=1 Tax=Arachis hypogaea TaxID=3818 RepID=A0A444XHC1_ARAHY|nr:uncharacterized protein LOC107615171 [Arachis ipaensis]RYQ89136.1 hypothetical protein Ahy_B09g095943 [Arachis hypogaea]